MSPAEYKATRDRVELLSRLLIETDPRALHDLIVYATRTDTLAPFLNPTAWMIGRDKLRMVRSHAGALLEARDQIVRAAIDAGEHLPEDVAR